MIFRELHQRGVTLVEMALVLLILGILTRAAITPLVAVQKHRNHRVAENHLQLIKAGLWAHVVATGVLPCPLSLDQSPTSVLSPVVQQVPWLGESQAQSNNCQVAQGGVPARLLGLAGAMDARGALLDPWNRPYQLAVSLEDHTQLGDSGQADWTTPGEASRVGIAQMMADLVLCNRAVVARCPGDETRANQLAFVLFSTGEDPSSSGEQSENQDADNIFVLQELSVSVEHPFDDLVSWGSSAEALYWMLRAGWLP